MPKGNIISAQAFANALLQHATRPDDPGLIEAHNDQFRRELLYLKLFGVLYVLEIKTASAARFQEVLVSYDEGLNRLCDDSQELKLDGATLESRFDTYAAACHASSSEPGEAGERNLPYWDVGREFTQLVGGEHAADDSDIARHAYVFLKYCQAIANFVDEHEGELASPTVQ
ncbi:MAG: hypothetical protein H0X25_05380 [Acidobacteriales bacterium]|nr:hypothetical protein [Terriglobales bacterium]